MSDINFPKKIKILTETISLLNDKLEIARAKALKNAYEDAYTSRGYRRGDKVPDKLIRSLIDSDPNVSPIAEEIVRKKSELIVLRAHEDEDDVEDENGEATSKARTLLSKIFYPPFRTNCLSVLETVEEQIDILDQNIRSFKVRLEGSEDSTSLNKAFGIIEDEASAKNENTLTAIRALRDNTEIDALETMIEDDQLQHKKQEPSVYYQRPVDWLLMLERLIVWGSDLSEYIHTLRQMSSHIKSDIGQNEIKPVSDRAKDLRNDAKLMVDLAKFRLWR
ncbi:MAG: hypothetical protein EOP06_02410 [Proteobacteria bacterium]|nr:MAG: hypothetical protein EOP06_02410 [Pseudomonadota bacterium]